MLPSDTIESNLEINLENSSAIQIINDDNNDITNEETVEVNSMNSMNSMDSDGHNSEISFYDWDRKTNNYKQTTIEFRDIYEEKIEFKVPFYSLGILPLFTS